MQHLWLFTSTLLVAIGVIQVEGHPAGGETSGTAIKTEESLQDFSGTILSNSLDLNQDKFIDASDTFKRLILGQARGNIPFVAAYEYLNNVANTLPRTARALQAVSFTIRCIKTHQEDGIPVDVSDALTTALQRICNIRKKNETENWGPVATNIFNVTILFDDENETQAIVDFLKRQYRDLEAFEEQDSEEQLALLQKFSEGIHYNA